jgi:UDP-2,3-diacylglucosamine hydrolase
VVDFISDLHLQASDLLTVQAWERYLAQTRADAVFILGDLFEVWVGDDSPDAGDEEARFERHCLKALHASGSTRPTYFMHGNRDFLFGAAAAGAAGVTLLDDPTVLTFGGQRWLLSHGDALCLDDADYLRFRAQVRGTAWQQSFQARPLQERRAIARGLRLQSEERKASGVPYADVDAAMARDWLQHAGARTLIHGHTHRPADHALGPDRRRHVLSDWDLQATPARAEVLRLQLDAANAAVSVRRLSAGAAG